MPRKNNNRKYTASNNRSLIMAAIHSSNTKPEIIVRKILYHYGYRYRIHYKKLPGSPDIVLLKHKIAIFVQGCFWHYHGCHISHIPKSNKLFWQDKIKRNLQRDKRSLLGLLSLGWRVLFIWECAVTSKTQLPEKTLLHKINDFINKEVPADSITGTLN